MPNTIEANEAREQMHRELTTLRARITELEAERDRLRDAVTAIRDRTMSDDYTTTLPIFNLAQAALEDVLRAALDPKEEPCQNPR